MSKNKQQNNSALPPEPVTPVTPVTPETERETPEGDNTYVVVVPLYGIDGQNRREPGYTFTGDPETCEPLVAKGYLKRA